MKRIVLIIASCITAFFAIAQNKLLVQGTYPDLYINHKITSKESLSSISRLYNIAISPIAKVNDIGEESLLSVGSNLKIPVTKNSFSQDGQQGENETLLPLYHIVKPGETLFHISQAYGKLRLDFLREWNDLNIDLIQPGQKIIIGHFKVLKEKAGDIYAHIPQTDAKKDRTTTIVKVVPKVETKPEETKTTASKDEGDEGYFVTQYPSDSKDKQLVSKTGNAATFKTTSGWTDRKYYVLIDDIVPGTIVRITGPNNKSICAKVLGAMPEMKENKSLLLRMSNATASALHISDPLFQVQISFYK